MDIKNPRSKIRYEPKRCTCTYIAIMKLIKRWILITFYQHSNVLQSHSLTVSLLARVLRVRRQYCYSISVCLSVLRHEIVSDQNDARYLGDSWASCSILAACGMQCVGAWEDRNTQTGCHHRQLSAARQSAKRLGEQWRHQSLAGRHEQRRYGASNVLGGVAMTAGKAEVAWAEYGLPRPVTKPPWSSGKRRTADSLVMGRITFAIWIKRRVVCSCT